jgi:hypothetical protein
MTMKDPPAPRGNILKSNSNGTYFGLSIEHVNRDERGFVDFEKMIGLDGIALVNIVSNPDESAVSHHKLLQSRITHNDGEEMSLFFIPFRSLSFRKHLETAYTSESRLARTGL